MHLKNRPDNTNYTLEVKTFLDKNESIAFVPNKQKDTNRFRWHSAAEEFNVGHKTLKLWSVISLCGTHGKPITEAQYKGDQGGGYDSDYECDYECDSEDCTGFCCYRDESVLSKMRTVVIFNKEGTEKTKRMNDSQLKVYLAKEGIIEIVNKKYSVK